MQDAVGTCLPCLYDDGQPGGGEEGGPGGDVHAVQLRGDHLLPLLPIRCLAVPYLQPLTYRHLPWDIYS